MWQELKPNALPTPASETIKINTLPTGNTPEIMVVLQVNLDSLNLLNWLKSYPSYEKGRVCDFLELVNAYNYMVVKMLTSI